MENGASQKPGGGRKLVIKAFQEKPRVPKDFEGKTWAELAAAVSAVHKGEPVQHSLESLYRAVESMCQHKFAGNLYERLKTKCDGHIAYRISKLQSGGDPDAGVFLVQVQTCWNEMCSQMLTIRSIFLYLDRTYVMQTAGVRSLWDLGLQLTQIHLNSHPDVKRRIVVSLLTLIQCERNGEAVDRTLLKTLLRMLSDLEIYQTAFEGMFLQETAGFYETEGERRMAQTEVPEYLIHCEKRLHEESDRCLEYMEHTTTRKPLNTVCEEQLLSRHVDAMLKKGFAPLMDRCQLSDLSRMYALFCRVHALEKLRAEFSQYIKATGKSIVMDEGKDKELVESLLNFKSRLDSILTHSFADNESFGQTMKESFEHFINLRQNKPAELIAKFLDSKLRSGNKSGSDDEMEVLLDAVLLLFRYIQGKDVFEAFYKKDLAKRLLLGKSASIDAEKLMISKLKTECGSQFTNKLEGMFKDIDLSRDIMASFKQAKLDLPSGIEMNVHVLTSGFWPSYAQFNINLPEELHLYQNAFKDFYDSKHNGRKLTWKNSLGQMVLKSHFRKGSKDLIVSLFQGIVLLLFNDAVSLSYDQIKESTLIEEKELERTLQSLACGKSRVLLKEPKGRNVQKTDNFTFNDDFTHNLFRIKINTIQMKETTEENQTTTAKVFQDRQYQIDAAIVRIMKTRKQLSHRELMAQVFGQLNFEMHASDLKKRIESLIDREYLERDANQTQMYNYLA